MNLMKLEKKNSFSTSFNQNDEIFHSDFCNDYSNNKRSYYLSTEATQETERDKINRNIEIEQRNYENECKSLEIEFELKRKLENLELEKKNLEMEKRVFLTEFEVELEKQREKFKNLQKENLMMKDSLINDEKYKEFLIFQNQKVSEQYQHELKNLKDINSQSKVIKDRHDSILNNYLDVNDELMYYCINK